MRLKRLCTTSSARSKDAWRERNRSNPGRSRRYSPSSSAASWPDQSWAGGSGSHSSMLWAWKALLIGQQPHWPDQFVPSTRSLATCEAGRQRPGVEIHAREHAPMPLAKMAWTYATATRPHLNGSLRLSSEGLTPRRHLKMTPCQIIVISRSCKRRCRIASSKPGHARNSPVPHSCRVP